MPTSMVNDAFGYVLDANASYAWTDIAVGGVGQRLSFANHDQAVSLRALGFPFPFYEYLYTHIQISIDGVIYLGSAALPETIHIRPLPFEGLPNAILAPFWADLVLALDSERNNGEVWVRAEGAAPNRSFTIQWNNVYRLGSGAPLIFQAVIKESGDIVFNYKSMGDIIPDIPIGIEDSDGIDGIQYRYDVNELVSEKSIYIARPAAGARLKALPLIQGRFLQAQAAVFDVTVRNTGTTVDNYQLSSVIESGNSAWQIGFLRASQPITETGAVSPGREVTLQVAMNSVAAPLAGDFAIARIQFQSTVNPAKQSSVTIQGAVPSEFAKVHVQALPSPAASVLFQANAVGLLKAISAQSRHNLAILRLGGDRYLVASDQEGSGDISRVGYTFIDLSAQYSATTYYLPDNSQARPEGISGCEAEQPLVRDLAPSMAVTPDGNIGIIFVREILKKVTGAGGACLDRLNSNIWFATVNAHGVKWGPINITRNDAYGAQQTPGVDFYTSPTIAATSDHRFILSWVRRKPTDGGQALRDVFIAHLDPANLAGDGSSIPTPMQLTEGTGNQLYFDPLVTPLRNGGAALVTSVYQHDWMEYFLNIFFLDGAGNILSIVQSARGTQGIRPDAVQLRNGNLLVGYTTPDNRSIGYLLITPDKSVFSCRLPAAGSATLDYVSITADPAGNGVLTWADRLTSRHYYTLISPDPSPESNTCALLTPPIIYGNWPVGDTIRSHYNQHSTIAPFGSPKLFAPLIGQ
jgi:hypothetical protein